MTIECSQSVHSIVACIWLRIAAECEENLKKENRQPVTGC